MCTNLYQDILKTNYALEVNMHQNLGNFPVVILCKKIFRRTELPAAVYVINYSQCEYFHDMNFLIFTRLSYDSISRVKQWTTLKRVQFAVRLSPLQPVHVPVYMFLVRCLPCTWSPSVN